MEEWREGCKKGGKIEVWKEGWKHGERDGSRVGEMVYGEGWK